MKQYHKNPRKLSAEQEQKLRENIIELGDLSGIVHDLNTGEIISGNQRSKIIDINECEITLTKKYAKITDQGTVAVGHVMWGGQLLNYREVRWNEEQRESANITANALGGEWDMDILKDEFDRALIGDWGIDIIPLNKMDVDALRGGGSEEDDYAELKEVNTDIILGDLFEIGNHRLLCGDSTNKSDIHKLLNGEKNISIYTDHPYGINTDGNNSKRGKDTSLMKGVLNLHSFKDDSIQYAVDAFNLTRDLNANKEVWWGANYYCHFLPQSNNWLVWDKRVEDKMRNNNSDCELAYVIDGHNSVRIFRHLWNGLLKGSENKERRVHPTQKPIILAQYCIEQYEMKGIILDLFIGSGSAMVGAHQLNRVCYGMDNDPIWCQVIINRMKRLFPELIIKKNGVLYND